MVYEYSTIGWAGAKERKEEKDTIKIKTSTDICMICKWTLKCHYITKQCTLIGPTWDPPFVGGVDSVSPVGSVGSSQFSMKYLINIAGGYIFILANSDQGTFFHVKDWLSR